MSKQQHTHRNVPKSTAATQRERKEHRGSHVARAKKKKKPKTEAAKSAASHEKAPTGPIDKQEKRTLFRRPNSTTAEHRGHDNEHKNGRGG